jgi:REP element-mobilizing transposase RayT
MGSPHKRILLPDRYYHVYNRGNRKQAIFIDDQDCIRFRSILFRFICAYDLYIIGHCLMPNHFHLIVLTGKDPFELSKFMQRAMTSYVMYFNRRHNLIGRLFQSPYNSKMFEEKDLKVLKEYIRRNPEKAGLTEQGEQYEWVEVL